MSSPLHAVAAVRPLHAGRRVLFLGRSCFPVTSTPLSFTRSYSHVSGSWSSELTHILEFRHLSSGRGRNEQYSPKGQAGADDSNAANTVCSHSDAEAASQSVESSSALPDVASSVISGETSASSSGSSVDSNPNQLSNIAPSSRPSSSMVLDSDASSDITENSLAGETTVDAVSDINMAKNEVTDGAQHKPSRPCLACGSPDHLIRDCPDRTHIKPNVRCRRCGSLDHWLVDCTASSKVRNAYRTACSICGTKGHLARNCPNRAQHKPSRSCAACGSPDHWMYDCPDRTHIKPESSCLQCGSPDHWAVDCTAPVEERKAYRTRCRICGQRGHTARDCTDRAEHKPSKPCPLCGSPDHWKYDCPDRTHIKPNCPCRYCGSPDHWAADCTASIEERKAYRGCTICGQKGHTGSNCPDRAAHKPPKPCPACGSPGHWLYDCPDKTPGFEVRECAHCGGLHATSRCRETLAKRRVRRPSGIVANRKK